MKRRAIEDPYRAVIEGFNRRGVRYVVVGMAGINYYARNPAETFATLDYDVFLEPSLKNVAAGVKAIEALGFDLGTREGGFEADNLREVVRNQRTIVATTAEGLMVELLLKVSGFPFSELAKDAAIFTVGGIPVRVGRLAKLLRSKRLAGRAKDRQFLKRYQALLEDKSLKGGARGR